MLSSLFVPIGIGACIGSAVIYAMNGQLSRPSTAWLAVATIMAIGSVIMDRINKR